jgi:hypothetical protein
MQGFDVDEACGHKNLGDRAAVAAADQLLDSRALEPIELSDIGSTDVYRFGKSVQFRKHVVGCDAGVLEFFRDAYPEMSRRRRRCRSRGTGFAWRS